MRPLASADRIESPTRRSAMARTAPDASCTVALAAKQGGTRDFLSGGVEGSQGPPLVYVVDA